MKTRTRLLAAWLCLSLLLPLLLPGARATSSEYDPNRPGRVLVALGDSFASGEGIGDFFGEELPMEDKCQNEDWLAHRSTKAWACQLKLPGASGTMVENLGTNFFFAASSGAVTNNIRRSYDSAAGVNGRQTKMYDRDGCTGVKQLPGQLDVFYDNPNLDRYEVDYVTLSIGGNDVDFEGIISEAAHNPANGGSVFDLVDSKLVHFNDPGGTRDKLRDTYKRVAEAAPNATILVTGYPELLDYAGGGACFSEYGAKYINDGVHQFNARIKSLIESLKKDGIKIEFVDVETPFETHQAYSKDSYINGVKFGTQPQDLQDYSFYEASPYSIHPNAKGAEAYAKAVQKKIDELEAKKALARGDISEKQNIVLVLDTSGSMEGAPIRQTRSASKSFIDNVLKQDASIGIVTYSRSASQRSGFTKDAAKLKGIVDGISTGGNTNTEAGLRTAAGMLNGISDGKRIILLMSDGLANEGLTGAALMEYIQSLKDEGIYFYTLGFFEDLYDSDLNEGQSAMEQIASPGCHYEVEDVEQLTDVFNDIADQVNGQNYSYFRIACPVDVEVSYGGETLSSITNSTRTSFGTLTFEAGTGGGSGSDNRTKILRLREDGASYQIQINGNGEGTMHFTAGFMDENGEYTDLREIPDVPITPQTRISANTDRSKATILQVDSNGDGFIDKTYSEGEPESGFGIWWIFVLAGIAAAAAAAVLLLRKKKRTGDAPAAGVSKGAGRPGPAVPAAPESPRPEPPAYAAPERAEAADPSPEAPLFCMNCGARQPEGARFCGSCGTPLPSAAAVRHKFCRNCGAKADSSAAFCRECGTRF